MGLATDSIFVSALQSSQDLMTAIEGRLYGTSIPVPDEELDNAPVPYVIVAFNSLTNEQGTKDDLYESHYDNVKIGIEVTGRNLNELHTLTQMVRNVIHDYLTANETDVDQYSFSAQSIQYASEKPCFWQTLNYDCEVYNNPLTT